jgi:hypothetical protein
MRGGREMGYVDGEPSGMDPKDPEEAAVELNVMRADAPVEPWSLSVSISSVCKYSVYDSLFDRIFSHGAPPNVVSS